MSSGLHVIFGYGQVGVPLADILLRQGKSVRVVKRSKSTLPDGAELMLGDAGDASFCDKACMGAEVIYHCMNPPYNIKKWRQFVPLYMTNLIRGASKNNARLVVLDNLYCYGATGGLPLDESSPMRPTSKKGEVRAQVTMSLMSAIDRQEVQACIARGSDFYGPGGTLSMFGDFFWKSALKGKKAQLMFNPDTLHSYTYIPDVAESLALLGDAPDSDYGRTWMLPTAEADSTKNLVKRFSDALGQNIELSIMGGGLRKVLGFVIPIVGELGEMVYQWDDSFVIDDSQFREHFGLLPTDPNEGAQATVAWAKEVYS